MYVYQNRAHALEPGACIVCGVAFDEGTRPELVLRRPDGTTVGLLCPPCCMADPEILVNRADAVGAALRAAVGPDDISAIVRTIVSSMGNPRLS